jgi:hypothetical protein
MAKNKNMKQKILYLFSLVIAQFIFANFALAQMLQIPSNTGLPDPASGIKGVIANLLNWLLGIVGIVAIIAFVISGFQYFMSAGDEKTAAAAKRNMTYSVIGIVVALSGFIVIQAVDSALGMKSSFF